VRGDPRAHFRFASLQSETARRLLAPFSIEPEGANSILLVEGDRVYARSDALLRIAARLRFPWPLAGAFRCLPRRLRDAAYDVVAGNRKRWFGTVESCPTPSDAERERFL
jgi:predicted DCC family thiol-disulfide oxidoreductase YuxK